MKKILGGILLAVGLIAIILGVFYSYLVFTDKKPVPQVFKEQGIQEQAKTGSQEEIAQKLVQEQLAKLLPQGSITKLLNLISWSVFIGLLFLASGKVAEIGIKLLSCKT